MAPGCLSRSLLLLLLPLTAAAGLLAACGGEKEAETPPPAPTPAGTSAAPGQKVSIQIITNGVSPFWDSMKVGMKRAAEKYGCDARDDEPQRAEIAEQLRLIENAMARKVDGLAVSAIEAGPDTPKINEAVDAGILTITFDSDAPKSKRLIYIGTNNFKAGQAAGEEAKKLFPNGGKIVAFVGNRSAENAREREEGFKEALKGTNVEVVDVLEDNKDPIRARKNVEDIIQSRKEINGLLGLYSYNLPTIVDAVKAANAADRYKIMGFDAEPRTLSALQSGQVAFTIVQKPYEFGYKSVEFLYLAKTKGVDAAKQALNVPADGIVDTGVDIITPEKYTEFKKRLDELGVTSS